MSECPVSPFWNFSLKLYRVEGVAPACIKLQDQHGVDVNVTLFGLWLASEGRALSRQDQHEIMDAVESWKRQVVVPLRSVRRILKNPADASGKGATAFNADAAQRLRDQIKVAELEAERIQQEALFALKSVQDWGEAASPTAAAAQNLETYARAMRANFDAAACRGMLEGFARMSSGCSA